MSTQPNPPQATPRRGARRQRAITSTLAVVVALCTLSATGATAAAAEPSAPARVSGADPASPASALSIRAGTLTNRGYWCVPDVTRPGPSSRVGFDNEDYDDLDDRDGYDDGDADFTELVDLVDDEPTSRNRRGRDSTIWLDSGHGRQWPLDLGALGIRVRIGSPGESRYATSPGKQLTRSAPGKLRCRVTASSQTRTDRDNQRWACVLTDRDRDRDTQLPRPRGSSLDRPTNRTGGPIIIMRDQQRPSDRDWSDEQLWPGDRDWWPNALPSDRPRLLMPALGRATTSTPSAGKGRCLVMYSGEDGVEVHLGQLSKVTPPK